MDKDKYFLDIVRSMDNSNVDNLWKKADLLVHMASKENRHLAISLYKRYLEQDLISLRGIVEDLELFGEDDKELLDDIGFREYAIKYHLFRTCRNLAKTYSEYYYFDEALFYIDKAIEFCPGYHGGYTDKAEYLSKVGRLEEAVLVLQSVTSEEFKKNFPKYMSKYKISSDTSTVTGEEFFKRYTYSVFIKTIKGMIPYYEDKLAKNYVYKPRGKKEDFEEQEPASEIKLNESSSIFGLLDK